MLYDKTYVMNGKQLKNSILQWAIQGKLVPQDPNDEPASVLLDKIRQEKERLIKEKKIKRDKNASIIYRGEDNSYYEKILATGEVKCIDEEIPFEIPQGWKWTRIGNIFNHTSGKQQSSSNKSGGTPQKFITTSNLYWGYFVLDNVKVMNFTDEETRNCSATKGDLLVCEGGAGYGRSAIWNEDYDICLQNHVHRLRPCINGICEYVYYFIYLLKESNNLASVGTAMPGLSANRLKGLLLPLPPINEQKRIVSKMEELIPLINRYAKAQQSLDELNQNINEKIKKSCLHEAIQGWPNCPKLSTLLSNPKDVSVENLLERIKEEKLRLVKEGKLRKSALNDSVIFRGDDNKYYEQIGKKCVDITEKLPFDLPNNWIWCRLGNLVSITSGENLTSKQMHNGKIPVYGGNGITGYHSKANIFEETIVIGRVGYYCGSIHLTPCQAWVTDNAFITQYSKLLNRDFLIYLLTALNLGKCCNATAQPVVSGKKIYPLLIALPPFKEQQRIVAQIEKLFEQLR